MLITSHGRRSRDLIMLCAVGKVRDAQPQKRKDRADLLVDSSPSRPHMAQDSTDQYLAADDLDSGSTNDIQNLSTELIPVRQSSESASDEALDIVATLGDGEMELNSCSVAVRDGSDTSGQPQAHMSDVLQSPHLKATIAKPLSLSESRDDLERPKQMAEVVDAEQEREIRDIIGKEDVDGVGALFGGMESYVSAQIYTKECKGDGEQV
jgi:hypothetical protein